jgi:hypothetical protein
MTAIRSFSSRVYIRGQMAWLCIQEPLVTHPSVRIPERLSAEGATLVPVQGELLRGPGHEQDALTADGAVRLVVGFAAVPREVCMPNLMDRLLDVATYFHGHRSFLMWFHPRNQPNRHPAPAAIPQRVRRVRGSIITPPVEERS